MVRELPDIVRIKRKRNQDSLQALILEAPRNKRIKDETYVFKLKRTDNEIVQLPADGEAMLPLLQESSHKNDKDFTYVIPKEQCTEELPPEFTDMLDSILSMGPPQKETQTLKKKKQRNATHVFSHNESTDLDYVYDVYYRDKAVAKSWEKDRVGYIKFEEDYEGELEEESDKHLSDDEDSNAEDFYKNDYPDDEDDHTADEEGSDSELEKLTESLHKEAAARSPRIQDGFQDLYEEFYGPTSTSGMDFLATLNQELAVEESDEGGDDEDDLMDDNYEDGDYPRQIFFPDEEDDDLAKHRDKIFGKLQKMIDEHN